MKNAILIQARLSSLRFPKKMLSSIDNMTLLEYVYKRCEQSKKTNDVIIITSNDTSDDELYTFCIKKKMKVFRGELDNVLKRYIDAILYFDIDTVCRVCGDSPFVDVNAIDIMFSNFKTSFELDYMRTINSLNGFVSEVFTSNLLNKIYNNDLSKEDKEHVTKYILDNILLFNTKVLNLNLRPKELEKFTLTVDYPNDIVVVQKISKNLDNFNFNSNDIIKILQKMKGKK